MSTSNKKQRRDELNKVSGGFSFNGSIPAGGNVALKDSSDISKLDNSQITRPNNYQERHKKVCIIAPCD